MDVKKIQSSPSTQNREVCHFEHWSRLNPFYFKLSREPDMAYRAAGADTGDMSKDTLFASDAPPSVPKRTGNQFLHPIY